MGLLDRFFASAGDRLARYLMAPTPQIAMVATEPLELVAATLRPGDVLLVEGVSRISVAIKYLTQSIWSHAALYIGPGRAGTSPEGEPLALIEADVRDGVRAMPLSEYTCLNTRICRPMGLSNAEIESLVTYLVGRLGQQYDLKNLVDLGRYLVPKPPVPARWRRRMIAFGSGDPTRAICSTLIAQAFHSVGYPILADVAVVDNDNGTRRHCRQEVLHIRHHSLFTPRDFDLSPYFGIIKPTLEQGLDYRQLPWAQAAASEGETAPVTIPAAAPSTIPAQLPLPAASVAASAGSPANEATSAHSAALAARARSALE